MSLEKHTKDLEVEVDNYQATVNALRTLANELLWHEKSKAIRPGTIHCGRSFTTSQYNRHAKSSSVTPDLAIIPAESSVVVAEAKLGWDRDEKLFAIRVAEAVEQVEKYDDELEGWPHNGTKPKAINHDLALIVHTLDANRVKKALEARQNDGSFVVKRKLAIISYATLARAGGGQWPMLQLFCGGLSDKDKSDKLENGIPFDPAKLATSPLVAVIQLSDCEPPLPTMMDLVSRAIVENLTDEEQELFNLDSQLDKKVTISEVCSWLQDYAFPRTDVRDPVIPEEQWVRRAIHKLADIGWVTNTGGQRNVFTFHHRKVRKGCSGPLKRFIEVCARDRVKAEQKANKNKLREEKKTDRYRAQVKAKNPLFADQLDRELADNNSSRKSQD